MSAAAVGGRRDLPVEGVYSHAVSPTLQRRKLYALETMHDLRLSPTEQASCDVPGAAPTRPDYPRQPDGRLLPARPARRRGLLRLRPRRRARPRPVVPRDRKRGGAPVSGGRGRRRRRPRLKRIAHAVGPRVLRDRPHPAHGAHGHLRRGQPGGPRPRRHHDPHRHVRHAAHRDELRPHGARLSRARAPPSPTSARSSTPALGYVTGWSMVMDYVLNPIICTICCSKAGA